MNYAANTEIIQKHFHDHQGKFVYCCAFNHSCAQNIRFVFLNEGYFYSRRFQKYSMTSVETSKTFQGPCKPCECKNKKWHWKRHDFFFSKSPGPSKLNLALHLGCHTCWVIFYWWACGSGGWVNLRSHDYQNFSDAQVTNFSYPWCSTIMTCQNQSKVFMVFWLSGLRKLYKRKKSLQDGSHSGKYFLSFLFIISGVWKSRFCGQRLIGHHDALLSFQL